jgi:hypothetical protein
MHHGPEQRARGKLIGVATTLGLAVAYAIHTLD